MGFCIHRVFMVAAISTIAASALKAEIVPEPAVLTNQHVDVFAVVYNGTWGFYADDEDDGILYPTEEALNFVSPEVKATRPAGSTWDFLGVGAGQDVWILPQNQVSDVLYAGTRSYDPLNNVNTYQLQLRGVDGPGDFAIYSTNSFGSPTVRFATADGVSAADSLTITAPGHAHYNWAFTAPGIYQVEISATANLTAGGSVNSYNPSSPTYYYFAVDNPLQVASLDSRNLVQFDQSGSKTVVADSSSGARAPIAVAYDYKGNRYMADSILSTVTKYDRTGAASVVANAADGLLLPTGLTYRDSTDDLFVANYLSKTIVRIDANGDSSVYSNASKGLGGILQLAVNPLTGEIYASDVDNRRILKLDADGDATVFADASDGLLTPIGLEFDNAGNLFVSDSLLSKVFKFDSNGNATVFADASDGLLLPAGLALDPYGNLFVANYINSKVLKLTPDGVSSVFADSTDGILRPFDLDFFDMNLSQSGGASMRESMTLAAGAAMQEVPEGSSLAMTLGAAAGAVWWQRRRRAAHAG